MDNFRCADADAATATAKHLIRNTDFRCHSHSSTLRYRFLPAIKPTPDRSSHHRLPNIVLDLYFKTKNVYQTVFYGEYRPTKPDCSYEQWAVSTECGEVVLSPLQYGSAKRSYEAIATEIDALNVKGYPVCKNGAVKRIVSAARKVGSDKLNVGREFVVLPVVIAVVHRHVCDELGFGSTVRLGHREYV